MGLRAHWGLWRQRRPRRGELLLVVRQRGAGFVVCSVVRTWCRWRLERESAVLKSYEEAVIHLADLALALRRRQGQALGRRQRRRFAKSVLSRTGF